MTKHKYFRTYSSFFDFLKDLKSELILISPFIKIGALKELLKDIPKYIKVIIVCRWRISDIVLGVSDLEIYDYIKNRNGNLFINKDIHLKVLMKDKNEIIIGSANITGSGLGFNEKSNIEAITIDDVNDNDILNVMKIIKKSVLMDEILFDKFLNEVSKYNDIKKSMKKHMNKMNSFDKIIFKTKNLLVSDFPFFISPKKFIENYKKKSFKSGEMKHDLKLFKLSKNENINEIYDVLRNRFLKSDVFEWQKSIIKDKILFGKYSKILHDTLTDDPRPYRKKVKELVRNMFKWTIEFSDDFEIEEYKHTCSLCKK